MNSITVQDTEYVRSQASSRQSKATVSGAGETKSCASAEGSFAPNIGETAGGSEFKRPAAPLKPEPLVQSSPKKLTKKQQAAEQRRKEKVLFILILVISAYLTVLDCRRFIRQSARWCFLLMLDFI